MYTFKVIVTTLMFLLEMSLIYTGAKSEKQGRMVSLVMFLIVGLGMCAIWG